MPKDDLSLPEEEDSGDLNLPPLPKSSSLYSNTGASGGIKKSLEVIIPIILIIAIVWFLFFGGKTAFFGKGDVLVLTTNGALDPQLFEVLNAAKSEKIIGNLAILPIDRLSRYPENFLKNYKLVILDQTMGVSPADKALTRSVGQALQSWVQKNGNLIIVKDSGIYLKVGEQIDSGVIGWEASLGNMVPVTCEYDNLGQNGCLVHIRINGKIRSTSPEHPFTKGIDTFPVNPFETLDFDVLNVQINGKEIAAIETPNLVSNEFSYSSTAIAERKYGLGTVVYFNYNPAQAPIILYNTLQQLVK
jgi:hypothetical protein